MKLDPLIEKLRIVSMQRFKAITPYSNGGRRILKVKSEFSRVPGVLSNLFPGEVQLPAVVTVKGYLSDLLYLEWA